MANLDQYRAVIEDLIKERNLHQLRIGEIEAAISALRKLMPAEQIAEQRAAPQQPVLHAMPGKYTGMGVRWAILSLLTEDATGAMLPSEIAKILIAGGKESTGKNFRGNVSAVLSDMCHNRGEVESAPNGGWQITQKGRECWAHIKARMEPSSIFSQQPSLQ
jgi:hypothetical protein